MSLTLTAPTLGANSTASASTHRNLLLAADELIAARFNERSFLVFSCNPQPELGDVVILGTPDNLSVSGTEYDPADEDPPDPSSGSVLSTDATTQVIWLTGYTDTVTLNRRTVDYDAGSGVETWWVGTIKPQRFEPLGLVDICIEDYTDPTAGNNTTFTHLIQWDKYGCVRIHNGNRHALTVKFEAGSQDDIVIPPYGIACLRRPDLDSIFAWDTFYLPLTLEGDPLTWVKPYLGNFSSSMELLTGLVEGMDDWCRFAPVIDCDSTSREQASFTGAAPTGSDKLWDWLFHKGKLLSVVLDRRDGSTVIEELQWNGIDSIPDATWSGIVDVDIDLVDTIRFTSAVTPPSGAGPTEWEHDLIPISTNVTGGVILQLQAGAATYLPGTGGNAASPYTGPLPLGTRSTSNSTVYTADSGGASKTLLIYGITEAATPAVFLADDLDDFAPSSGGTSSLVKCFGAIGRWQETSSTATHGMAELPADMLLTVDTIGSLLKWLTWRGVSISNRRRFLARYPREFIDPAGADVSGSAVYDSHPNDQDVLGTTDGDGGELGWEIQPISTSEIAIEGEAWTRTASVRGRELWVPADLLHFVAVNINTAGWWDTNRDRIVAGTFEVDESLIAWRIPRMIDEWNALANAMNAVQEVYRADIRHLHKDPLPGDYNHPPFSYVGEDPSAVPADWICGRFDTDDALVDWCALWGLSPELTLPDVPGFEALDEICWVRLSSDGSNPDNSQVNSFYQETRSVIAPSEDLEVVNGYTFSSWKAFTSRISRYFFGGAGSSTGYVYLTATEAASVFDALGVPVMPPPAGERFTPVMELDSGVTVVAGAYSPDPVGTSFTEIAYSAFQPYRLPESSGSWIRVWDGAMTGIQSTGFRLLSSSIVGTSKRLLYDGSVDNNGTPFDTSDDVLYQVVVERDTSTDCVQNGQMSPRDKTLLTSAAFSGTAEFPIDPDDSGYWTGLHSDSAWLSGIEIYSTTPCLVIAAPEPYTEFAWDSPFLNDFGDPQINSQFSTTTTSPASGGLNHAEFTAGDMPVTVDTLQANSWQVHAAYHCQVVQRTGVLRA